MTMISKDVSASEQPQPATTDNLGAVRDTYLADLLRQTLRTTGGHLSIGRGGYSLHYAKGCALSGYGCDAIKHACIDVGVPVIDSRNVSLEVVCKIAIHGPMIAVGEEPGFFLHRMYSTESLAVVAAEYRAAGAEIFNIPDSAGTAPAISTQCAESLDLSFPADQDQGRGAA